MMGRKRKASELYDLCKEVINNKDKIYWKDLGPQLASRNFKARAFYQGQNDRCTALHLVLTKNPPLDVVKTFLRRAPETLKLEDRYGELPIHVACLKGVSPTVMHALIQGNPEGVKVQDMEGRLPIHYACGYDALIENLSILVEEYSEGLEVQDKKGQLPIHYACSNKAPILIVN